MINCRGQLKAYNMISFVAYAAFLLVHASLFAREPPAYCGYVFVPKYDANVTIARSAWMYDGKLDANGEFIGDCKYRSNSVRTQALATKSLTRFELHTQKAFEFRSRMLIPG